MRKRLVLELFPGISLFGRAFEEAGFCVVRGPDILFGGDIHRFHPSRGRFDGIIGGPPCQIHSALYALVRDQIKRGRKIKEAVDLIPEFARVVMEARPRWFLMENVPRAPMPACEDLYGMSRHLWNNRDFGGIQNRQRAFVWGILKSRLVDGAKVDLRPFIQFEALQQFEWKRAVLAAEGRRGGAATRDALSDRNTGKRRYVSVNRYTKYRFEEACELQGLPKDFELPGFNTADAYKAVGNGVPLHLGRALASAVLAASKEFKL